MKIETKKHNDGMEEAVMELLDTWTKEIDDYAEMLISDDYEGDAHMYALRIYVSAAMNLRNRFEHFVKSKGGVVWDTAIKKKGN